MLTAIGDRKHSSIPMDNLSLINGGETNKCLSNNKNKRASNVNYVERM